MSEFIELDKPISFGVYKGFTPISLIKKGNLTAIEYLLDLRGADPRIPRAKFVKMSADLHHTLDSIIRNHRERYGEAFKTRFSQPEYSLWLAEKKAEKLRKQEQKAAAEKAQQERIEKHKAEERARAEARRLKEEAQRQQREIEKAEALLAQKLRESAYQSTWAAW